MKASNLALRRENEPVAMSEEPRLARAVIGAEANEAQFQRPRPSLGFRNRHLDGRAIGISDQGLRLFRLR